MGISSFIRSKEVEEERKINVEVYVSLLRDASDFLENCDLLRLKALVGSKWSIIISRDNIMDSLLQRIGLGIKKARKEKAYTTDELARMLKISAGKLNNIENGKSDCFQLELVKDLKEVLGIDIYEMAGIAFYNSRKNYSESDEFLNELVLFLKNNSDKINTIFIEKLRNEFYRKYQKIISSN